MHEGRLTFYIVSYPSKVQILSGASGAQAAGVSFTSKYALNDISVRLDKPSFGCERLAGEASVNPIGNQRGRKRTEIARRDVADRVS